MSIKQNSMKNIRSVNWVTTLYLIISPFVAVAALTYWLMSGSFNWPTMILGLILMTFIQVSITAGYHRLFSHRTYNAKWPVRLFFLIFGGAAFEGAALSWSLDHRVHHNHVDDNDKDPYSIGKGFFWAHMGWLLFKHNSALTEQEKERGGDLMSDPLVVWQYENWLPVGFFAGFVLPALIALLWGDFFGGLFIAGVVRSVINHHSTFLINSLSHCVGAQTYSDSHSARDNLFTAILTFGEGYHNYHHEFPSDYRNGVRLYDWDPSKWVIKGLSLVGMTYDLKKIPDEIILRKKTQMKEKRMKAKLSNSSFKFFGTTQEQILEGLKEKYENAFKTIAKLRAELKKYQKPTNDEFKYDKTFVSLESNILKDRIDDAHNEFKKYVREWNSMRRQVLSYARAS
jgi:stearoyl-CoA desaturase (Delta-9 desaturase)